MKAIAEWFRGPSKLAPGEGKPIEPDDGSIGIYAWYADRHAKDLLRRADLPVRRHGLVYVGQTKVSFSQRVIGAHRDGSWKKSGLRKTVKGILIKAGLPAGRTDVTCFIREHLRERRHRVRHGRIDQVEKRFIQQRKPSFNMKDNPDAANVERVRALRDLAQGHADRPLHAWLSRLWRRARAS